MWEAIAANKRRSRVLLALMALLLVALGAAIGGSMTPRPLDGAATGALVAAAIWLIMLVAAYYRGDSMVLRSMGARRIEKQDAPRLWNVVEEMTLAAGLPSVPRVFVIDSDAVNAFAVGRTPEKGSVVVTSGLMRRLGRDELQGVVAHEIGHIVNLDIRFMTTAAVLVGSISLVSEIFLRGMIHGGSRGGSRRSSDRGGGGQARAILLILALVLAILAPIFARLLYFACSRKREYLADASAARLTRYPPGLANALEKIATGGAKLQSKAKNLMVAPMFIVNPLQRMSVTGLFSSHPPTDKRIAVLRSMAGGAGYAEYESAYRGVTGAGKPCLGPRTLASETESVAVREPTPEPEAKKDAIERAREALDLVDAMAGLLFIKCMCGVRIKPPPDLKRKQIPCPRCGRMHDLALATTLAANRARAAEGKEEPTAPEGEAEQVYSPESRKGWASIACRCGNKVQLSPAFQGEHIHCPRCQRTIKIES